MIQYGTSSNKILSPLSEWDKQGWPIIFMCMSCPTSGFQALPILIPLTTRSLRRPITSQYQRLVEGYYCVGQHEQEPFDLWMHLFLSSHQGHPQGWGQFYGINNFCFFVLDMCTNIFENIPILSYWLALFFFSVACCCLCYEKDFVGKFFFEIAFSKHRNIFIVQTLTIKEN